MSLFYLQPFDQTLANGLIALHHPAHVLLPTLRVGAFPLPDHALLPHHPGAPGRWPPSALVSPHPSRASPGLIRRAQFPIHQGLFSRTIAFLTGPVYTFI